jgi:hypothetical protein
MAVDAKQVLNMSDEDLVRFTLSGEAGSEANIFGQTVLNMRMAKGNLEASRELVKHTQRWVEANIQLDATTQSLVRATRRIVIATWGVVLITFVTQIVLIYLAANHK